MKKSADTGYLEAIKSLADEYYLRKEYEKAYFYYFDLIGLGNTDSLVRISQMLDSGLIKGKDSNESFLLCETAAKSGNPQACTLLGVTYSRL